MSVNKTNIVSQIVTLPRRFHILGDVSMFSLVEATGYFALHDQISEADIRAALVRWPECVQDWFQHSEDKRTSSGWYLAEDNESCYETGYVADARVFTNRVQYNNAADACAGFIKRELEAMRLA
jgi:hypothetical protein